MLPTRGGRGRPGLGAAGPGRGPGAAGWAKPDAASAAGAGGAGGEAGSGGAGGAAGAAGAGAAGLATGGTGGAVDTAPPPAEAGAGVGAAFAGAAVAGAAGALPPPNASRKRRATGASTVDDADFTNSPWSLSRARTSLLVTPSSLANSCTRALPATTSPSLEATAVGRPRLGFSYDAWSSGLHGVLMFFATCSFSPGERACATCSTTAEVSGVPVMRNARPKACRRIAAVRQRLSECSQAPRPGCARAMSTETAV